MYWERFYIKENIGNNALSFGQRSKLWKAELSVPSLKKISDFFEIKLLEENTKHITFEDFWFDGNLQTCYWLENFYELESPLWKNIHGNIPKIYLFDNHNHALYFWYLAKHDWVINDNSLLYHIDEHADYRDPWEYISPEDSKDLEKVFQYVNFSNINVWNYIIPAEKEWLVSKTIQIRSEKELLDYKKRSPSLQGRGLGGGWTKKQSVIVNIDLDFFQPDLDFIDYELKKSVIRNIIDTADVITVATSPFFIEQKLALRVFKDLFYK